VSIERNVAWKLATVHAELRIGRNEMVDHDFAGAA